MNFQEGPFLDEKTLKAERDKLLHVALSGNGSVESFLTFCGLLQLVTDKGGDRIPFSLSPIQYAYTKARTSRDIILKPRRAYVTTLEVARDIWWFLSKRGAHVLMVVPPQDDNRARNNMAEMFRIFFASLKDVGLELKFGGEKAVNTWKLPSRDAEMSIMSAGGSEISAQKGVRGTKCNRLHMTEVAFWGDYADETYKGIEPCLPIEGGEVVIESTPNGASGFYFDQWRMAVENRSNFIPHFFPWWHHPLYRMPLKGPFSPQTERERSFLAQGVTPEQIEWYRWKLKEKGGDARAVDQEYPSDPDTCFLVSGRTFFDAVRTQTMTETALAGAEPDVYSVVKQLGMMVPVQVGRSSDSFAKLDTVRVFHRPERGRQYVLALDPAAGEGGDPSAGILLERETGRHMATIWGQFSPVQLARVGAIVAKTYNVAAIAVERQMHGSAVLQALDIAHNSIGLSKPYPRIFRDVDGKPGWNNTAPARTAALDNLQEAHTRGVFTTRDVALLAEFRTFIVNTMGKAEGAKGTHDDLTMGTAIAWVAVCRAQPRHHDDLPPL